MLLLLCSFHPVTEFCDDPPRTDDPKMKHVRAAATAIVDLTNCTDAIAIADSVPQCEPGCSFGFVLLFFLGLHIAYRKRYSSDAYCAESACVCVCVGGTVMTPFMRPVSAHSPLSPLALCLCSNSSPNNGKNCNTLLECSHQEAMPAMPAASATRDAQWPRTSNKAMTVQLGMTQRLPV